MRIAGTDYILFAILILPVLHKALPIGAMRVWV